MAEHVRCSVSVTLVYHEVGVCRSKKCASKNDQTRRTVDRSKCPWIDIIRKAENIQIQRRYTNTFNFRRRPFWRTVLVHLEITSRDVRVREHFSRFWLPLTRGADARASKPVPDTPSILLRVLRVLILRNAFKVGGDERHLRGYFVVLLTLSLSIGGGRRLRRSRALDANIALDLRHLDDPKCALALSLYELRHVLRSIRRSPGLVVDETLVRAFFNEDMLDYTFNALHEPGFFEESQVVRINPERESDVYSDYVSFLG